MKEELVVFSLGSNMGNREVFLRNGLNALVKELGECVACSSIYETPPLGFETDDFFYNCAASFYTNRDPMELLKIIQTIEQQQGRNKTKGHQGYESRTLDIDIIYIGQKMLSFKELTIPHKNRLERRFVLEPIYEIHPSFYDPKQKMIIASLLKVTNDTSELKKMGKIQY